MSDEADLPKESGPSCPSLEDFQLVDCEAPLARTRSVWCASFGPLYHNAEEAAKQEGNGPALRVYRLLSAVTWMHFKPHDRAEPYGPLIVRDGKRSMIPDDLRGKQSAVFVEIAPKLGNAGLRARVADIAWLNNRKQGASAQLAIASYCEALRLVMDGKADLLLPDEKATSHNAVEMFRRACQIANATGWKDADTAELKMMIEQVTQFAFDGCDAGGYLNIGELNADYSISDQISVATQADILAGTIDIHPENSRHLWALAARGFHRCKKEDESNRCLISAAECHVAMAAAAGFKGMTAASWLMDAIKALRNVPATKARREELEGKLREAQASISDEMSVISTEIDLTDLADRARKTVGGLTLAQALLEFARLEVSPTPEKLREEALAQANENPLTSIFPMAIHDDEGKLVAQSPGEAGGGAEDIAIRHLISRHEGFRRQISASGVIDPARRFITSEHPLHTRHFLPLAALSPFVPVGHEDIFATGFARFFGGDFISALHVLVPQLENSLRYALKQVAIDPSSIQSNMTQESRTISVMLEKDRAALENIFGPAIVFEIENLFDFRGGPSVRHQLAHGLQSADACCGPDAIYACWFIFRLCCVPLFRHWQQVAEVYAEP